MEANVQPHTHTHTQIYAHTHVKPEEHSIHDYGSVHLWSVVLDDPNTT